MSQHPKQSSSAKLVKHTSTETETWKESLFQEIKEACLSEVESLVTLSLPHGSVLARLVEFAAKHGAEIIDLFDRDAVYSDEDEDEN